MLVRLPLWPRAKPAAPIDRKTGWALCQVLGRRSWSSGRGRARGRPEGGEGPLVEDGGDEAHVLHDRDGLAIAHGHAGGLLASVLQREQAVVDELRDRHSRGIDPEDSARFSHAVILPRRLSLPREAGKGPSGALGAMIDLHLHSTCSDGSETPEVVVELAAVRLHVDGTHRPRRSVRYRPGGGEGGGAGGRFRARV